MDNDFLDKIKDDENDIKCQNVVGCLTERFFYH